MTDIDLALAQLGQAPIPAGLAKIDDSVLVGVEKRRREAAFAPRLMGITATLALGLGIAGGTVASTGAASAQTLLPFASASELAPSTLLDIRP